MVQAPMTWERFIRQGLAEARGEVERSALSAAIAYRLAAKFCDIEPLVVKPALRREAGIAFSVLLDYCEHLREENERIKACALKNGKGAGEK